MGILTGAPTTKPGDVRPSRKRISVNVHDWRWVFVTASRSSGGMLETATRLVPRSGAPMSGKVDNSNTSKVAGDPARVASDVTTVSTRRDGEGVDGPVSAASNRRCASPKPADASPTALRSLASNSPVVTRDSRRKPKAPTTVIERTRVKLATRMNSDRRHRRRTARGKKRRTRPMIKSGGTGLVSDSPHSEHDLGGFGVALDLCPQALDVHVDQPCVGRVPVAPHLLE